MSVEKNINFFLCLSYFRFFFFFQTGTSKKEHVKRAHENMRPTDLAAAHQYDKVVSVITKDPDDRTDTDIHQIKSWFKKKSDLFNQLNDGKFYFITL